MTHHGALVQSAPPDLRLRVVIQVILPEVLHEIGEAWGPGVTSRAGEGPELS